MCSQISLEKDNEIIIGETYKILEKNHVRPVGWVTPLCYGDIILIMDEVVIAGEEFVEFKSYVVRKWLPKYENYRLRKQILQSIVKHYLIDEKKYKLPIDNKFNSTESYICKHELQNNNYTSKIKDIPISKGKIIRILWKDKNDIFFCLGKEDIRYTNKSNFYKNTNVYKIELANYSQNKKIIKVDKFLTKNINDGCIILTIDKNQDCNQGNNIKLARLKHDLSCNDPSTKNPYISYKIKQNTIIGYEVSRNNIIVYYNQKILHTYKKHFEYCANIFIVPNTKYKLKNQLTTYFEISKGNTIGTKILEKNTIIKYLKTIKSDPSLVSLTSSNFSGCILTAKKNELIKTICY